MVYVANESVWSCSSNWFVRVTKYITRTLLVCLTVNYFTTKLFCSNIIDYFNKPENKQFQSALAELDLKMSPGCKHIEYASNHELRAFVYRNVELTSSANDALLEKSTA